MKNAIQIPIWASEKTEIEEGVEVLEDTESTLSLVLHNDDVHSFMEVIQLLIQYCKHTEEQAEQCAWITHFRGKCTVKHGGKTELTPPYRGLQKEGLSVSIE
ncbi:MAG: ATP-dependent Clp protease adaptor ClpS [Sphingomonadales bacterium]|nr:ATP-dependent Clp protease adaptor ClpS [Sphingomonadales bacterium]